MTALCALDGMRRTTGDTWSERALRLGPHGLEERSRTPGSHPNHPPAALVRAMREARQRPPAWGAKKRLSSLGQRQAHWPWPARATGCALLRRPGRVPTPRQRRHIGHPGTPTTLLAAPNAVWTADVTGPLTTRDGLYGSPLTGAEGCRRFRLGCQALSATRVQEAKPVCVRLFQDVGWPKRLRTANGGPVATNTRARLAQLAAGWVRRGLLPEGIAPGQPPPTGRHERRHRTRQADPTRPPAHTRRAQPYQCDRFRQEWHGERPHAALAMHTPASRSASSPHQWPDTRPPRADPDRFEVRYVSANGGMWWPHPGVHVSIGWAGADVGLEEMDQGVWHVDFGPLTRGRLLERQRRLEEASGRLKRHR